MTTTSNSGERIMISAVIITFNEERNIRRCLDSLREVVDEIVVVDSHSTDNTKAICEEFGVRFISNPFKGYGDQKRFAAEQASYNWVLSLDADEVLSPDLSKSILKLREEQKHTAYYVNRLTNYCGAWIKHCGWYPDKRIRLWKKGHAEWSDARIHEVVKITDNLVAGHLTGDLLHYSYNSISDHVRQLDKFSSVMAEEEVKRKNGKAPGIFRILIYPWIVFVKMYFIKRGFLDGMAGFFVCVSGAYYRFLKYAKMYTLTRGLSAESNSYKPLK